MAVTQITGCSMLDAREFSSVSCLFVLCKVLMYRALRWPLLRSVFIWLQDRACLSSSIIIYINWQNLNAALKIKKIINKRIFAVCWTGAISTNTCSSWQPICSASYDCSRHRYSSISCLLRCSSQWFNKMSVGGKTTCVEPNKMSLFWLWCICGAVMLLLKYPDTMPCLTSAIKQTVTQQ